jgi:uncharacterized protein YwqG
MKLELPQSLEKHRDQLEPLARPAVKMVFGGSGQSRFAGSALLPADEPWPTGPKGKPLSLVVQIDLAEAALVGQIDGLPDTGLIQLFYDIDEQPWGIGPEDREYWKLCFWADKTLLSPKSMPAYHADSPKGFLSRLFKPRERPVPEIASHSMTFERVLSLPPEEMLPFELDDEESDDFDKLGEACHHQLGGFPYSIQYPSELCGDGRRLLLQVDTDDAIGWMWGDAGMIYLVSTSEEYDLRDPSTFNLVLQCC